MWLLIAFIAVPLIEIALFIQVGGAIGLWPTLAIVVATAVIGTLLVRSQGVHALNRLRQSMSTLSDPTEALADGAMILFSGALLLTPGFFTDALGLSLLVPGVRAAIYHRLRTRIEARRFHHGAAGAQDGSSHHPDDRIIDADFEEVSPPKRPTHEGSGWTRH